MCSICGILGPAGSERRATLEKMNETMASRGPDQNGYWETDAVALAHNRLAILDVANGRQPMTRSWQGHSCTLIYNGELYNTPELTRELERRGVRLETRCDTEVVLYLYLLFGQECAGMMNGIFAFAVYDQQENAVYFARDRFGVKPLFYAFVGDVMIFASEMKALLRYPGLEPVVDQRGLWQLLFLSPVRMGHCIWRDIRELEPACDAVWKEGRLTVRAYWRLEAKPCRDSREEIIAHTRELLTDAIRRQLASDVPLCALLSGGLDSSVISAVAAEFYRERGERLSTYSFEYEGNRESFRQSLFQPQSDDEYALEAARWLDTDHQVLTASTLDVVEMLEPAVQARDFPGQADIDSSLAFFLRQVRKRHTVAVSGECADEIFGGYPWFYRPEMLENPFFPWIHQPLLRAGLFQEEFAKGAEGYRALSDEYRRRMSDCPVLEEDSPSMSASRRATWLSVQYFMLSLLERKDRMSMASSVEVRVPFADHRVLEYVYNVPWEIKFEGQKEKALLRNAMGDQLPQTIVNRKKSPYPKTQNPAFEAEVYRRVKTRMASEHSLLGQALNRQALEEFLQKEAGTWFGQLMGRAQMLAWLLQLDLWAEDRGVIFRL